MQPSAMRNIIPIKEMALTNDNQYPAILVAADKHLRLEMTSFGGKCNEVIYKSQSKNVNAILLSYFHKSKPKPNAMTIHP